MIDAGRWELVKRLFEAALGRPAADRAPSSNPPAAPTSTCGGRWSRCWRRMPRPVASPSNRLGRRWTRRAATVPGCSPVNASGRMRFGGFSRRARWATCIAPTTCSCGAPWPSRSCQHLLRPTPTASRASSARRGGGRAQSSPHCGDLRIGTADRRGVRLKPEHPGARPRTRGRTTLAERIAKGALPHQGSPGSRAADCRGARGRARERHRPPRSKAGQHQSHAGRHGEGARLRPGEGVCRDDVGTDPSRGNPHGHPRTGGSVAGPPRLHEPGAGARARR